MRILVLTPDPDSVVDLQSAIAAVEPSVESSLSRGLGRLQEEDWGLVLLDTAFHEDLTVDLVKRITKVGRRVVVLARTSSPALVTEAMRNGAVEVLQHPLDPASLAGVLQCLDTTTVGESPGEDCRRESSAPTSSRVDPRSGLSFPAIGRNPGFLSAYRTAERIAPTHSTVLIQGESGTGKEMLAKFVHQRSARAKRPFIAVNCAALPEPLLESELFGHEKGAFTGAVARKIGRFERAHGGTLFLDEISEASLLMQAKLLRVLQEHVLERVGGEETIEVDVRIVVATNRDLEREVAAGHFREDLYYRLAVIPLWLPALRDRPEDIPLLAKHFLEHFCQKYGRSLRGLSPGALQRLLSQSWPGNVRQLQNAIERAVLMAEGGWLQAEHLALFEAGSPGAGHRTEFSEEDAEPASGSDADSRQLLSLEEMEQKHIQLALTMTGGHLTRAAEVLGIHRNTLSRKLQAYSFQEHEGSWRSDDSVHFAPNRSG